MRHPVWMRWLYLCLALPAVCAMGDPIENGDFDAPFPASVSHFVQHWHHYGAPTSRVAVVSDPDPARGQVLRLNRGVRQHRGFCTLDSARDYRLSFWVRADHAVPQVEFAGHALELPGLPDAASFAWTRIEVPLPAATRASDQVNLLLSGQAQQADGMAWFDDIRILPDGARFDPSLNCVQNGAFEATVTELRHPAGWMISDHPQEAHPVFGGADVDLDPDVFKTGTASLRIRGRQCSALLQQHVDLASYREQGIDRIRFSGWVRSRGLEPHACAQVQIGGQYAAPFLRVYGDTDWTYGSEIVDLRYVDERSMRIALRLPYATRGTAWFDGIRITEVTDEEPHNLLRNARFLQTGAHPRLPSSWGFHRWGRLGFQDLGFETYGLDDTHAPPLPGVRVLRFHNPGPVYRDPAMRGDLYRISKSQRTQIGWVVYSRGTQQGKEIRADESLALTFSAYFRAERPDTAVRISGAGLRRQHDFSVGTEWERHHVTYGGGREGFFGERQIQDVSLSLPQGGATVWMAAPQLEIGDVLHPFAPGPGEVDPPSPQARNPVLPPPHTSDPHDPFAGLTWRIPEPRLALQRDGTLAFEGRLVRSPALRDRQLRLHIAFPQHQVEGSDTADIEASPRPIAFRFTDLRMRPSVVKHTAVRVMLADASGNDLGAATLPVTRSDQDVNVWRDPLAVWVEYDTVTTDATLRVRMHWRRGQAARGRAWIADARGTVRTEPIAWSLDGAGTQDVAFDIGDLPDGDYIVWAETDDAAASRRATDSFSKHPQPAAAPVRMNRFTRGFEVDGEPFIPIFLPSSLGLMDNAMLDSLRKAGFSSLCSGVGQLPLDQLHESGIASEWMDDARFHLDRLNAAGMRLIYRTGNGWGLRQWYDQRSLFGGDVELLARNKIRVVEALRNRPELLGWYYLDEPNAGKWEKRFGYQESDMARLYRAIKAADPTRPVFVNWNNTWPAEPYGGIAATDVLCHDNYGIAQRPLFDVDSMVGTTRMINNKVVGRRPSMIWTCGSYPIHNEVSPHAVHVHGWLHLVYGTRGIGYWSTRPINPQTWQAIQQLNHEAQTLAKTAFGPRSARLIRTAVHSTHIHYAVWQTADRSALLAINTSPFAVPLDVDVAAMLNRSATSVARKFSPAAVRMEQGVLREALPGFARRVYVFEHAAP